jgi:2-haloacid dehalogenase
MTMSRRTMLQTTVLAAGGLMTSRPGEAAQRAAGPRGKIIVFDVNETMLDVDALAPQFQRVFGSAAVAQEWFTNVVMYSQVTTVAGPYADFGTIARAVLEMTAAAHRVTLSAADRDDILRGLVSLPAHPDVPDGLKMLRDAGFRLVTLTNSAPAAVGQQLTNAKLATYFEHSYSVDAVKKFKPAPDVYRMVATEMHVDPSQLRLVAAHAWDVLGAMRAGLSAAFIARPGKALYPLAQKPDIVGPTLREVAAAILKTDKPA